MILDVQNEFHRGLLVGRLIVAVILFSDVFLFVCLFMCAIVATWYGNALGNDKLILIPSLLLNVNENK